MATNTPTLDSYRDEYRAIRKRSGLDSPTFAIMVGKVLLDAGIRENATPAQFVKAASMVRLECYACHGSGKWYGAGHVENGVFKGKTGPCYRCESKGYQVDSDRRRNWSYDNHYRTIPGC